MKYSFLIDKTFDEKTAKDQQTFIKKLIYRNKISYFLLSLCFGFSSISEFALQYYLKDILKLQPAELSQILSIIMIPWFIKPFFGILSDLYPICGYRRKSYLILCGSICVIGWNCLSIVSDNLITFVVVLIIINTFFSFITVISQAIIIELSQLNEKSQDENNTDSNKSKESKAKDYISYFFFFKSLGSLFSSILKGILVKYFEYNTIFMISSIIPFVCVISGFILMEFKIEDNFINENHRNHSNLSSDNEIENITDDKEDNKTLKETEKKCSTVVFEFICQRNILIPLIFIIFYMSIPNYDSAMFYFYTETLRLTSIDLGIFSLFTTISSLITTVIYRFYLKNVSFKKLFYICGIIEFFLNFLNYFVVIRFNLKIGISDMIFVIFSNCFIQIFNEVLYLPILSLAAILTPKNLEGTAFSVYMSAINFGSILAGLSGSFMTDALNLTKDDHSNLKYLIIACDLMTLLPLLLLICINKSYFESKKTESEDKLEKIEN